MAEFHSYPNYDYEFATASDSDMIILIKKMIDDVMIENAIYYDTDDRKLAVGVLYPIVCDIVFNPYFSFLRDDKGKLLDLITYLATPTCLNSNFLNLFFRNFVSSKERHTWHLLHVPKIPSVPRFAFRNRDFLQKVTKNPLRNTKYF